jgi:hypothetical protein
MRAMPEMEASTKTNGVAANTDLCDPVAEPWVSAFRQELVDSGFDPTRVDQAITTNLERFRSSRIRDFVPVLVERAVYRSLRSQG